MIEDFFLFKLRNRALQFKEHQCLLLNLTPFRQQGPILAVYLNFEEEQRVNTRLILSALGLNALAICCIHTLKELRPCGF